jgi:hypothetical protein
MTEYAAEEYEQINLTLDNTVVFNIMNPSEWMLEWIKDNPPDYLLNVKYFDQINNRFITCAWKDNRRTLAFKLIFAGNSQFEDFQETQHNITISKLFKSIKKEYNISKDCIIIEYKNKK